MNGYPKSHNKIKNKSTTPRQLAGNIILAVDEEELLTNTITGFESNKKGESRKTVKKLDEKNLVHVKVRIFIASLNCHSGTDSNT